MPANFPHFARHSTEQEANNDILTRARELLELTEKEVVKYAPGAMFSLVWELCAEVEELRQVVGKVSHIIYNAPELNMSNYDNDQVAQLNAACVEVWSVLRPVFEQLLEEGE